jgi:hypothetical protein
MACFKDMLQIVELARILVDQVSPPDRNTREGMKRRRPNTPKILMLRRVHKKESLPFSFAQEV